MPKIQPIRDALHEATQKKVFPGAVLLASRSGEIEIELAAGLRARVPTPEPMRAEMVFDLSSLTKPLATTLAVLRLVADGRLSVDDRLTRFFHNFGVHGKGQVTVRHLLTHTSGLQAHRAFYDEVMHEQRRGRPNFVASRGAKEWVYGALHRARLQAPTGSRVIYSDLGFMLLGQLVEMIGGRPLDEFCRRRIFGPLGLQALSFVDLTQMRIRKIEPRAEMIAATQACPIRQRVLCGEVDDANAWVMGGVAGHAGLFGAARDVERLARALRAASREEGGILPPGLVDAMWTLDRSVQGSTRTLGWDSPAPKDSSAGTRMSERTVGHLGFTGVSLWMDLERDIDVVLLTNRVHTDPRNDRIRAFRPRIHDLVMGALA